MSERIRAIGAIREHSNILLPGNKDHEVLFIKGLRRKKLRFGVLADSSLCQNGKQVEIITKMIFELCYIESIIAQQGVTHLHTILTAPCAHSTDKRRNIAAPFASWLILGLTG